MMTDENLQQRDGVRKVVKVLKAVANKMGLRRKVEEQESKVDGDCLLPNTSITAGTFSKNIKLWITLIAFDSQ